MLEPIRTGLPVNVKVVRPKLAVGVLDWESTLAIVNDPEVVERSMNGKVDLDLDEYAALRAEVQRLIGTRSSSKAKNIGPYAEYIVNGIMGEFGDAWSVPPLTLWCPRPLIINDAGDTHLPIRDLLIAVDAETQITAMHRIKKNRKAYGLGDFDFSSVHVAFEVYHGVTTLEAKQIFHDRNLKGVPVDKSLALSMDTRDLATTVTRKLVDTTTVTIGDESFPLAEFIVTGKRQIGPNAREWVTLSAMRTMVVTTLLGKSGIQSTSGSVEMSDLPGDLTESQVIREVVEGLTKVIHTFTDQFASRTAIATPAVMAGLGATMHRTMSWSEDKFPSHIDVMGLLGEVRWERDAKFWGGVSATEKSDGKVTWGGGAKDSGYKVYEALTNPASDVGKKIRGLA